MSTFEFSAELYDESQSSDETQVLIPQNHKTIGVSNLNETFKLWNQSKKQVITFVLLASANLLSGCAFAIIAPFFPAEVRINALPNKCEI